MEKQASHSKTSSFTEDQVRLRAYFLWKAHGEKNSLPDEYWYAAIESLKKERSPLGKLEKFWMNALASDNRAFSLDVIKTFISALGLAATVLAGLGLYLTYRSSQEQQRIAQKQQELDSERLITERFTRAVEQLGSQNIDVRIGGIYSLEQIAEGSKEYQRTIMEVLSAFIRNKSSLPKVIIKKNSNITTDIQSALTVIGRRNSRDDLPGKSLNLTNTDLSGASLRAANFQAIILNGANLQKADLSAADLQGVSLRSAKLLTTNLRGANLQGANLNGANLQGANLNEANLQGANLVGVNLEGAKLANANLEKASFESANLNQTVFWNANLKSAVLTKASLKDSDLQGAFLEKAYFYQTKLCRTKMKDGKVANQNCKD